MPTSGMLFANDHEVARTFIFDVRDPLRPKVVTSFTNWDGYMHLPLAPAPAQRARRNSFTRFPKNWCGVPTIVGHYLIQSVPVIRSLIVLDIAEPMKPVETSRLRSATPIVRTGPDSTPERSARS